MAATILLVEDQRELVAINRAALMAAGFVVLVAPTLQEARALLKKTPDLVVLDIMLPDGSGLALLREIRQQSAVPVLLLTSLGESEQIVQGLGLGGSDYMVKPCRVEELVARVKAQLNQVARLKQAQFVPTTIGGVTLDYLAQRAHCENVDLLLKPKEFLLLALLLKQPGKDWSADALYAAIWGMDSNKDTRAVTVHVSSLKRKLEKAGARGIEIHRDREGLYAATLKKGGGT